MGTKRKQKEVKMEDQTNNNVVFSSDSAFVVRSTRDDKPLHFTLKIQSFSLLKAALANSKRDRYESHSFDAGGYKWWGFRGGVYVIVKSLINLKTLN